MRIMSSRKNMVSLAGIYLLSQFMLLFVSGQWWDDWVVWTKNAGEIKQLFWEMGGPWEAYNLFSVMWIPNGGYRVVVFLLFFVSGLLFYKILCSLKLFSQEDAFWVSAIAMTAPVNDARITLICYGYSLSLCLFMISFFLVTRLDKTERNKKIIFRVISLILLLYSYTMPSLLVFTGLIWLYLFYLVWNQNEDEKFIGKCVLFVKSYWDYIILPFAFYILHGIFFKPYGRYAGYNAVTFKSLLKGILLSPIAAIKTGIFIAYSYVKQIRLFPILFLILAAVAGIYVFYCYKNHIAQADRKSADLKRNLLMIALGGVVYYAGAFAYIVVRDGNMLYSNGVVGRDAMLLGFGIGIMTWFVVKLLPLPKTAWNLIPVLMICLGIFHFHYCYWCYQENWYQQQVLAMTMKQNEGFLEDDTVLFEYSSDPTFLYSYVHCGNTFYVLNGISYTATGKMDKFIFAHIGSLFIGDDFSETLLNGYNCDDYDASDMTIDGVLLIDNPPLNHTKLLKVKFDEIFRHDVFEEEISSLIDVKYIRISEELSDQIYDSYSRDELTPSLLREMVMSQ